MYFMFFNQILTNLITSNFSPIQQFLPSHMILRTRRTNHWVRIYASLFFIDFIYVYVICNFRDLIFFIDPNGELCKYLKGLAEAEDVQSYVKDNAFGVPAITSSHPDWDFYSRVRSLLCSIE